MKTAPTARNACRGITIVEILAVIGVIIILMAILLPSIASVRGNAVLMHSFNHMRQVAAIAEAYSKDNRETVVPSAFDYTTAAQPGKVRSNRQPDGSEPTPPAGMLRKGTWADILWTHAELGPVDVGGNYSWRYDAPDGYFYALAPDYDKNPFRALEPMVKKFEPANMSTDAAINANDLGSRALPEHLGQPGMFAMNNFFDSRTGNWYTTAQVRRPAQVLFLVDSLAGETIDPVDDVSGVSPWEGDDLTLCQVDFRYVGRVAAILFMDGHTDQQSRWEDLDDLQGDPAVSNDNGRGIRVTDLDKP
ncbi:MAG: type II secretion system protein [Phycisphaerae bacterium]|nr:type II secretion system protein [Phycisphaerae bacterium]